MPIKFIVVKFSLSSFIFFLLVLLLPKNVLASNEWSMFRKDPFHTGFNSEEILLKPPLQVKWSFGSPGGPNSPAVSDGMVYAEFGGVLFARDATTGDLIWSKNTPAYDHSSVAVSYGLVFEGNPCTKNCGLVVYDAKTGVEKWRINLPIGARGPTVKNGVVYFGSDDKQVRAANAYTGELLWTSPVLDNGMVSVPAVSENQVFVGSWSGTLYSLNSTDGTINWQFTLGGAVFSSPSVLNNIVYVGSGTENVYAVNAIDGSLLWKYTGGKDSVWGSPAIAYGNLYIQDLAGYIHALNASNGSFLWLYKTSATGNTSYSSPAIANGVVYIGSKDKFLYALDSTTGALLWKYETGGEINSSPAIANGLVYIGSKDGRLYAFAMEETMPTPIPSPTPPPLPNLNVPYMSQFDALWGSEVYDSASHWSENPFISRWGCALTSAAMVLKYHGHDVNPKTLNDWLKIQPDGYLRNGLLNWLAVSRFTYLNRTLTSKTLEYRRFAPTNTTLIAELTANRPVILKEPGHFIVAKSQVPSSFGINDPAFIEKTTLESYSNTFQALNTFKPTATDLSYLFLVTNFDKELLIFDDLGNDLSSMVFIEYPLQDDLPSNFMSGLPLKLFMMPTPTTENYKITIKGTGDYQLDSYLYQKDGNVTKNTFFGNVSVNQPDEFIVDLNNQNTTKQVTLETILNDIDTVYLKGLIPNSGIYQALRKLLANAVKIMRRV